MSRETVIALRRFTEKVATGRRPFIDDDTPTPLAPKPGRRPFIDDDTPPPAAAAAAAATPPSANYDSAVGEETGIDLAGPSGRVGGAFGPPPAAAKPPAAASWLSTLAGHMPPATTSMGVGLGGLGAYGLARLLQSEEDRKKNKFPWLATLLGAAGGGYLGHMFNDPAMQTQATRAYNSVAPRAMRTESANADMDALAGYGEEPAAPTANAPGNAPFHAAQR